MNEEDDSLHKHILLDGRENEDPATIVRELVAEGPPPPSAPPGRFKQFYRDVVMVLTEPTLFFEKRFPETSFTYAMLFAITVNFIAAFVGWLTRLIRHETLFDSLIKMREKLQDLPYWKNIPDNFWAQGAPEPSGLPEWSFEVMGIIISPFQIALHVAFFGILILLGCFMLVPKTVEDSKDPIELKTTMKILAFVSAPLILTSMLGFLPMSLAAIINFFYALVLTAVGLSIRFRVSMPRAFGIILLPEFIGFGIFGCFIGVIGALFFGVLASIFGAAS